MADLRQLIVEGDAVGAMAFVRAGADVHWSDEEGYTALHHAAALNRPDVAQLIDAIVEAGADVAAADRRTQTALHLALLPAAVQALVAAGAELDCQDWQGNTPLVRATQAGRASAVDALVAAGANVDEGAPLRLAAKTGHADIVRRLLAAGAHVNAADAQGCTPLRFAAITGGSLPVVQALLAAGADMDARDKKNAVPLHVAAELAPVAVVEALLAAGCAVDKYDSTPLLTAARYGRVDVVRTLLAAGADADAVGVLVAAASREPSDTVEALLAAGANPNQRAGALTPLHVAVAHGCAGSVRALLAAGAAVDALDCKGRTPLGFGVSFSLFRMHVSPEQKNDIIDALLLAGASVRDLPADALSVVAPRVALRERRAWALVCSRRFLLPRALVPAVGRWL